jgi:hypothetical protein
LGRWLQTLPIEGAYKQDVAGEPIMGNDEILDRRGYGRPNLFF